LLIALPSAEAVSHGSAASTAIPVIVVASRNRGIAHVSPTIAAMINPVGVSPASATQNTSCAQSATRRWVLSPITDIATHGRQP
jgi:hypothetical protein